MDIQEEHNSEQADETPAPEQGAPLDSPQKPKVASKAAANESPAEKKPKPPAPKTASPPAKPKAVAPGSPPEEADKLRSLVKQRDGVIVDLRARNEDLQQKLNEKEKVVTALTSRLEQAAEQLDRIRRSGADRGGKILSGIPAEVIEEQKELINDLKAALQQWEDLQSSSAMGRFEAQIGELREMLAEQLELKDRIDHSGKAGSFDNASTGSQKSSWDQMKAQLLGGDQESVTPEDNSDVMIPGAEPDAETEDEAETQEGQSKFAEKFESEFVIDIPDRPAAVENLDEADVDSLKAAIEARDGHIDRLMEVIDALKEISGQGEMEEAKQRQKDLEGRLEHAEGEMKDKLRQAEIEMSMERAKLAREAARLQQMGSEPDITDSREKNGVSPSAEEQEEASGDDKGGRWARFLGSK